MFISSSWGLTPNTCCPDCGAVAHDNKKAVRSASKTEIEELLKIQKEDKEETQNEST